MLADFVYARYLQKEACSSEIARWLASRLFKPGFHMIVRVGNASPRQAQGHIEDSSVKWKHVLSDVSDVADQTGRGVVAPVYQGGQGPEISEK